MEQHQMQDDTAYINITVKADYLGASVDYPPLHDEDWRRGKDLPDGKMSKETLENIFETIRKELFGSHLHVVEKEA